ncbi:MAG TPA: PilZ domain-containing protein [Candidatus Acidoferrales bacterium]|nr:PilZ domain-containing protein [Candidatus Acidoferrales bacterium]
MSTRFTDNAAHTAHWDELTEEAHRDRRREPRLNLPYAIEVYGFDGSGHYFMERTVTLNVSSSGCMVELKHRPEQKSVLAILRVSRDGTRSAEHRPMLFQVCWTHKAGRRWTVGASKLQPDDMWGLTTPQEHIGN